MARLGMAGHGEARYVAGHGGAGQGKARPGEARYMARSARELLKEELVRDRGHRCELRPGFPHHCEGGLEMHEIIYTREIVRMIALSKQLGLIAYITDPRNCVLLCSGAHQKLGRSKAARSWLVAQQVARYGRPAMEDYVRRLPNLKLRRSLDALLST